MLKQQQYEHKMWENMQEVKHKHQHAKFCKQQHSKIHQLEKRLASIQQDAVAQVTAIRHETIVTNETLRQHVLHRLQKSVHSDTDEALRQAQETIEGLRRENALIRRRNETLRQGILNLRINNERLCASNTELGRCIARLQHSAGTGTAEQLKLFGMATEYKKAIAQVTEHLDLHQGYAVTERRIVDILGWTMNDMLKRIDDDCKEPQLVQEVQSLVENMIM